MRKFNILQLMTDSKIGGAEKVVLLLAKGLNKERFNVSVCSLAEKGQIFEEMDKEGIKSYSLGIKNRWHFLKLFKLMRIIKRENIQILHSHLFHANLLGRLVGKFMRVPVIISTEHIMGMEGKLRMSLNKITSILVDKFIAVSVKVGDFLKREVGIEPSKVLIVQNGVEYDKFVFSDLDKAGGRNLFGFTAEDKIIGTVARIHKQKGHSYLLHAAKEVIKEVPGVKFLIVGEGPLRSKMEKLSADLNIKEKVVFAGFYKNIPLIMSILDLFVLPSLWEGLPITVLEAMAMRKAVIATDVSGNSEVVEDNVSGVLVPPKRPHCLARAIIRLLKDDRLRVKMGEAGYHKGRSFFNAERMIKETTEIYERLIK